MKSGSLKQLCGRNYLGAIILIKPKQELISSISFDFFITKNP